MARQAIASSLCARRFHGNRCQVPGPVSAERTVYEFVADERFGEGAISGPQTVVRCLNAGNWALETYKADELRPAQLRREILIVSPLRPICGMPPVMRRFVRGGATFSTL